MSATLPVPSGSDGAYTITAEGDDTRLTSEPIAVPVISDRSTIHATVEPMRATTVATLPWGGGDGQAGYVWDGDAPIAPISISADPRDGSMVILDQANWRVLVAHPDGISRAIPLPRASTYLEAVVVNGTTGTATVMSGIAGESVLVVYLVDLDTGAVTTIGPDPVPDGAPRADPLTYVEPLGLVYAEIGTDHYAFFDVTHQKIDINDQPTRFFTTLKTGGQMTVGSADSVLTVALDTDALGLSEVAVDRSIVWILAATLDPDGNVQDHLVRVDGARHEATDYPTQPIGLQEATNVLTTNDGHAYLMRATTDALVIERFPD
jgi:hypothetical protein